MELSARLKVENPYSRLKVENPYSSDCPIVSFFNMNTSSSLELKSIFI